MAASDQTRTCISSPIGCTALLPSISSWWKTSKKVRKSSTVAPSKSAKFQKIDEKSMTEEDVEEMMMIALGGVFSAKGTNSLLV